MHVEVTCQLIPGWPLLQKGSMILSFVWTLITIDSRSPSPASGSPCAERRLCLSLAILSPLWLFSLKCNINCLLAVKDNINQAERQMPSLPVSVCGGVVERHNIKNIEWVAIYSYIDNCAPRGKASVTCTPSKPLLCCLRCSVARKLCTTWFTLVAGSAFQTLLLKEIVATLTKKFSLLLSVVICTRQAESYVKYFLKKTKHSSKTMRNVSNGLGKSFHLFNLQKNGMH